MRHCASANSRGFTIASLLNSEAPAPPSPEPEYHTLSPTKNKVLSTSPDPDGENSDDRTSLKNATRKGDKAPQHRLPTSAEPRSHGSITPNGREQAIWDRIKACQAQDAVKKDEVAAKPFLLSLPVTNKPHMVSPDLIVHETTSPEKVMEVATHVAADRNATTKERPSYDNEKESILKASTETATEETAPVMAAGPMQPDPSETAREKPDPADSKEPEESEDVTRVTMEIPVAPEAVMDVSPQPPTVESEPIQTTKPTKTIEPIKDVEFTKSSKPKNIKPEVIKHKDVTPRSTEPNDKSNNIEPKSSKTAKPIKPKGKKTPIKDHRSQPSANVQIISHRKMAKGDFDFELHLKSGDTTWWDEEVNLFSKSPEIVSDYWSGVRGGRERACDGMWKVLKIFDERRIGNRKEYHVSWLGTMDRTWESKAYVRANALGVLEEWKQKGAEEE